MNYLNTLITIKNDETNILLTFLIKEENNCYYLDFTLNENKYDNIPLERTNLHIYKSDNIKTHDKTYFKDYKAISFRVYLKFKDNVLCPVSTLYLTCEKNNKNRVFSLSVDDIIENGFSIC